MERLALKFQENKIAQGATWLSALGLLGFPGFKLHRLIKTAPTYHWSRHLKNVQVIAPVGGGMLTWVTGVSLKCSSVSEKTRCLSQYPGVHLEQPLSIVWRPSENPNIDPLKELAKKWVEQETNTPFFVLSSFYKNMMTPLENYLAAPKKEGGLHIPKTQLLTPQKDKNIDPLDRKVVVFLVTDDQDHKNKFVSEIADPPSNI